MQPTHKAHAVVQVKHMAARRGTATCTAARAGLQMLCSAHTQGVCFQAVTILPTEQPEANTHTEKELKQKRKNYGLASLQKLVSFHTYVAVFTKPALAARTSASLGPRVPAA